MAAEVQSAVERVVGRVGEFFAILAGIALVIMVLVIAVGVVMRFALAMPILGSNEIVQLTAVAVVALGLPYCTAGDGHVRVDVLDQAIGPVGRFVGDVLSRVLSAIVLGVLVWRASLKAADAFRYGDATNMLTLPIWPFYGLLAFGVAMATLALLAQLFSIVTGKAAK
jgi:TRAP-type C4-dicarboxylate transport system permease small subunit